MKHIIEIRFYEHGFETWATRFIKKGTADAMCRHYSEARRFRTMKRAEAHVKKIEGWVADLGFTPALENGTLSIDILSFEEYDKVYKEIQAEEGVKKHRRDLLDALGGEVYSI